MEAHAAFEAASDQQPKILEWLGRELTKSTAPATAISIGSGSGILDLPLMRRVRETRPLEYVAVEPIHAQSQQFEERLTALERQSTRIEHGSLDSIAPQRGFDFVLAIHMLYYVEDLQQAIAKLVSLCAPGGEILIAIAPNEVMNQLASIAWGRQKATKLWFAEDVEEALRTAGLERSFERIDAFLPVSPDQEHYQDILSFLIQSPIDELPPALGAQIERTVEYLGGLDGPEQAIAHPVSMLTVRV